MIRHIILTSMALAVASVPMNLSADNFVVADSVTHIPLPNASVYNCRGKAIGMSDLNGVLPGLSKDSYPITVRYLGYYDRIVTTENSDTVFLSENVSQLPEVVVSTRRHRVLHVLAYVR